MAPPTKKLFVSTKDESVRMFKNDFVNSLSKVYWYVPLIIYIPIIIVFSFVVDFSILASPIHWGAKVGLFIGGLFVWSLFEYIIHRFIFHFHPKRPWLKRIHWIAHGVHHDFPQDSTRLVMPPSVSLPLAVIIFFVLLGILGFKMVSPAFVGFVVGYLVYDILHYASHHWNFKWKWFRRIKKHHMDHHYKNPDAGFGFTSTAWDRVFRTMFHQRKHLE